MDINRTSRSQLSGIYEGISKESVSKKVEKTSVEKKGDRIAFSNEAKHKDFESLTTEKVKATLTREIPYEKIAKLHTSVKEGNYCVPAKDIANAMLYGVNNE